MTDRQGTGRSRWLGLRSYEENDASLFFGRSRETDQMLRMVRRETLTIVFAPSGTGKTSLLRAGLFPRLREDGCLPIWMRLDHTTDGVDHFRQIRKALERTASDAGLEVGTIVEPQVSADEETAWEYLHRVEIWNKQHELVTPVIVLDQFEEVFTVGQGRPETASFIESLGDIIHKRIPTVLRERLKKERRHLTIPTELQRFRFIISLRQDFVPELDDLKKHLPAVMRNRYPLHELSGSQAIEAILGPGSDVVSEPVARKIVRIVAGKTGTLEISDQEFNALKVEPNHLSLVCDELDRQRQEENETRITADNLEEQSRNILRRFYEESFFGLEPRAKIFVEENLLTASGYRKSQPLDDAEAMGLSKQSRKQLVNRHVLRLEDHRDIPHVELTHDLLTGVVQEARDRRHDEEEKQQLKDERRAAVRRLRVNAFVSTILFTFLALALVFAFRARKAEKEAERNEQASEELVSFMTNDLYDRLLPIGRLDLLQEVAVVGQRHYESSDLGADTEREKLNQARALNKIANVLAIRGFPSDAAETHATAIALVRDSLADDSTSDHADALESLISFQIDLARISIDWGNPEAALRVCEESMRLLDERDDSIAKRSLVQSLSSYAQLQLARAYIGLGQPKAAKQALERSSQGLGIDLDANSLPNPSQPQVIVRYAELMRELSQVHRYGGHYADAIACVRRALTAVSQLNKISPGNNEWLLNKAEILNDLGELHLEIGDFAGAKDKFDPVLAIATARVKDTRRATQFKSPDDSTEAVGSPRWERLIAIAYRNFGRASKPSHRADSTGEKSTPLEERAQWLPTVKSFYNNAINKVETIPANPVATLAQAKFHSEFGVVLSSEGELPSALPHFEKALALLEDDLLPKYESNPKILREYGNVLLQIGLAKLEASRSKSLPDELERAVDAFSRAIEEAPRWAPLYSERADARAAIAESHRRAGRTTDAVELLDAALADRNVVYKVDPSVLLMARKVGEAQMALADMRDWAEHSPDSAKAARQVFLEAKQAFDMILKEQPWRVADRLAVSEILFRLSKLESELGNNKAADQYLRNASEMGCKDATLALKENAAEDSKTSSSFRALELLARRQESMQLTLPCQFLDEFTNDTKEIVVREVDVPILVTGPQPDVPFDQSELSQEMKRLEEDFMLKLSPTIEADLHEWYDYLQQDPQAEFSLARLVEIAVNSLDSDGASFDETMNANIELQSPVRTSYPRRTPTVIGRECWFRWGYKGSERDIRDFQLQVCTHPSFGVNHRMVFNGVVSGTGHRHVFDPGDENLNRELFWRVRYLSRRNEQDDQSVTGQWSVTRSVEVYESLWKRINSTKKLRIGISEFEGDLLEWEPGTATVPTGFDGNLINHIRRSLSMVLFGDEETLQAEPYSYSWDGMFEAASRCEVDFAISVITRTRDREKRFGIRFTEPYYETSLAIVSPLKRPVKAISDLVESDLRMIANKDLRGAEIGKLIVDDRLEGLSYPKLDTLLEKLTRDIKDAAITDHAFVYQYMEENPDIKRQLHVLELTDEDYLDLIDAAEGENLRALKAMFRDFGGASFEQYAIAVSERDDGLRRRINEAILEYRRGATETAYKGVNIPIAKRLYGPNQIAEEDIRMATILPLNPDGRNGAKTVFGDSIEFHWHPLLENARQFRLQIASSPDFSRRSILHDQLYQTNTCSVTEKSVLQRQGRLYWRGKVVTGEKDLFPQIGWSQAIAFDHYDNCIERIKSTGRMLVAVNVSNGYSVFRSAEQSLDGFDIQIVRFLLSDLAAEWKLESIQPKFVEMDFTQMLPSVQNHDVDIAISGITKTSERESTFELEFSMPYCRTRQAAVVLRKSGIDSSSQLKGLRFIAFEGTRALAIAEILAGDEDVLKTRSNPKEYLLEQLLADAADITIMDHPTAIKLLEDHARGSDFRIIPLGENQVTDGINASDLVDDYAIAIQKDQAELRESINNTIRYLRTSPDGLLEEIFEDYQGQEKDRPFQFNWNDATKSR